MADAPGVGALVLLITATALLFAALIAIQIAIDEPSIHPCSLPTTGADSRWPDGSPLNCGERLR